MEPKPIKESISNYIQSLERKGRIKIGTKSTIAKLCQELAVGVTLIAGRESVDREMLAVSLAMNLVKAGARVLFVSRIGQDILDIISRYMGSKAGHGTHWLPRDRHVMNQTVEIFRDGVGSFGESEFYYAPMDIPQSMDNLESMIMNASKESGWDYIFVDSLQDFVVESSHLEHKSQREYLCERLHELSYELMAPIIVTTQYDLSPKKYIDKKGEVQFPATLTGSQLPDVAMRILFVHQPHTSSDKHDKNGLYICHYRNVYVYFSGKTYSSTTTYLLYSSWATGRFWDLNSVVDPAENIDFYHESIIDTPQ